MSLTVRLLAAAVALALAAIAPAPARATVVRALTLDQKAEIAKLIVLGRVERVESRWQVEGARVETIVRIKVLEVLKGDARIGDRVAIQQGGGKVGGFVQNIAGTSPFATDEEAILFLEPLPNGHWVEIGIGIGKYGIEKTAQGKQVTHAPDVALATTPSPGHPMKLEQAVPMKPVPLAAFMTQLRARVALSGKTLAPVPAIAGPAR